MFVSKLFGKRAWVIDSTWFENTVIYSFLAQVVWQEGLNQRFNMDGKQCNYTVLLKKMFWQAGLNHCYNMDTTYGNFSVFWNKWFGKKAGVIDSTWLENIVIYSFLEQVVWQEGLNQCFNMEENSLIYSTFEKDVWQVGLNHCYNMDTQCFGTSGLERRLEPLLQNIEIYGVLKQVVWKGGLNHRYKTLKLQCFETNYLARRLEPLFQHG